MSVSIQSPLLSDVVSCLESLSPPPTPIAKRARRFFPSEDATPPTPMFFPKSQSILQAEELRTPSRLSTVDMEAMKSEQLEMLASRPAPRLRLKPRLHVYMTNTSQKENINYQMNADQAAPFPFSLPPSLPSLSVSFCESSTSVSSGIGSEPTPKKSGPAPAIQRANLPSIQRNGTQRGFFKCNSFAAMSA
ncbi:hypothetical protein ACHAWF_009433 [Thalassiosira exigua]